ncbi:SNF2-related protein [Kitasatospora sp. NPDC098663]|uniref:SNF2-related protein n=1 Tax=Kitasatospora sp. NPDC098663 TaxID=3364096 RepID=UPI0037F91D20
MPPLTSTVLRCASCGRGYERAADRDQWNGDFKRGVLKAVICPKCQSPDQVLEAVVNDALRFAALPGAREARAAEPGEWQVVQALVEPAVRNDPGTHLVVRLVGDVLRLAVAGHSDAALVSILAPGLCTEVATAALADEGATATGQRVLVNATTDCPADIVYLAADHASLEDGEDRGELILYYHPAIPPGLLRAFAPRIAALMQSEEATAGLVGGSAGLLARLVSDDALPWISTSWMSGLLARPGALPAGTDLARLDRRVLRSLQEPDTTPGDLVAVICCPHTLAKSEALAWKVLAADLAVAWTALECAAWAAGMTLARRSACVEPGLEACQLALHGRGWSWIGPVGVAAGARGALHRALLALLETLAQAEPHGQALPVEGWAGVEGLVAWVDGSRVDAVVSDLAARAQPPGTAAGGGRKYRQAKGNRLPLASAAAQAEQFVVDSVAELAHQKRVLAVTEQLSSDAERRVDQWRERVAQLVEAGAPENEILAASADLAAATLRVAGPARQDYQWEGLRRAVSHGGAELSGTAHRVGDADGQPLWVGRIQQAPGGGNGPLVEGPVQPSEEAALNAAALLAAAKLDVATEKGADLLRVWHLVPPQESLPLVEDLARAGVLLDWDTAVEGDGPCMATMSARAQGQTVRVQAPGTEKEFAVEQCARALLAVLSGERGFGPLAGTAQAAGQWLEDVAGEPWHGALKRRTTKPLGGGRQVELKTRVGAREMAVVVSAEVEPIAELAARWLLVQELAGQVPPAVLERDASRARQAAAALREESVLGEVEFAQGPGGPEAVVARAALGDGRVWAAGPDREQACAGLLAAVRWRLLAPQDAARCGAGEPGPHWVALFEPPPPDNDGDLACGERLLAAVHAGARLCVVGVDGSPGSEPGFVTVQAAAPKARPGRGGGGWRLWSERGALAVPGPAVPVVDAAQHLLAAAPDPGWDASAAAWREILRFGCQVVAAGQVRPGLGADGTAVWRPGPLGDEQHARLEQLAAGLPPWGHSAALGGGRERMLSARATADLVLGELTDALVRGPGVAPVWGHNALTARTSHPVRGAAARWLDDLEELADPTTLPGIVVQVMPPPRPDAPANSLQVTIRLRPAERGAALVALPDLTERHGAQHPAVRRARRALRRAAALWPPLAGAGETADRVRVSPGEAALLLGHLGRVLRHAGVEVVWPEQWAACLRTTVVASGPPEAGLALDQLVDYRWQLRLDGSPLTPAESERIAAAAGTLMWLRNRWVLVDEVTAGRAHGRRMRAGVPAGEALQAVLLGSVELEDGEHADVVADGALADLAGLLTGAAHTPIAPPPGLAGTLWPYQGAGLTWLASVTRHFGAILADEMGLGKTVQTIALVLHRIRTGQSRGLPVLVVAPASMVLTWVRHLAEFAPALVVRAYHGPDRSLEGLAADEVVVTSYGTLLEDRVLLAGQAFSLVVADEAQFVKNPASQRARALTAVPALTRLALTGTPMENRLADLWALLNWTNPALFASQAAFMRAFGGLEKVDPDPQTQRALNRVTGAVMLRRRKVDPRVVLDLPEKITSRHVLALTPTQVGLYTRATRLAKEVIASAPGRERSAAVLRLITQLRQICNHPLHLKIGSATSDRVATGLAGYDSARSSSEACKLAALDDLVPTVLDSEPEASMVLFTEFTTMAMVMKRHAAAWDCRPLLYTGAMTPGQRDVALTRFRDRHSRLLIVTYGSGGTGLDLTTANHAVLVDSHFNPARIAQAVDRLHRPGQKHTVHVHHLQTAGTIEEKIERLLARKRGLLDALTPSTAFDPALLSTEELLELISLAAAA